MPSLLGQSQLGSLLLASVTSLPPATPLSLGAEIATYLQSIGALDLNFSGPGDVNLFVDGIPDAANTPDLAVAVMERGGLPPVMTLTANDPALVNPLDRPQVQIRVRAPMGGYVAGNTLANSIFGALQCVGNNQPLNAGGAVFTLIMAQQSPVYIGRDERQRHGWSQNFAIIWSNWQR